MTFSPLISGTVPHHNKYSSRQGRAITRVNQHHHAAWTEAGLARLTNPSAQASATYIIMSDGRALGQVPEEFRPWTTSTFEADAPAITFEVQNISGQKYGNDDHPESWAISDAAYNTIINLTADIAHRYNWGGIGFGNYRGHREFWPTACPGGYLWTRMDKTRAAAQAVYSGGKVLAPATSTPPVANKTLWQLSDEVIDGVYGSGEARRVALGAQYDAVQALVNQRLGAVAVAAQPKSTAQLADEVLAGKHGSGDARKASLGSRYTEVQNEINRRLGGVNISALADAVLRGQYGSGDARRAALGANYAAVQAEVNRRLR